MTKQPYRYVHTIGILSVLKLCLSSERTTSIELIFSTKAKAVYSMVQKHCNAMHICMHFSL
uniref:Uncharacterized protein n=1 Tax=Anguilla anguilla TaxID=7936 RepID=A0A0E9T9K4_ANGAN